MTERLYYNDCYLREFEARVVERADEGRRIYLDRTAFYPASGGQPFDLGELGGVAVKEIVDEEERIAHVLEAPLADTQVRGQIDWPRRFDHMQQHTGQHLLSAVLVELYGMRTVSFHMGAASSTIEVETPALESKQLERVEERCAEIVWEARPVTIAYEDSSADLGLRKPSARAGTLRIISIDSLDRSACGGTHLRSTAEIGPILLRKLEKIRGNTRLEFVCGLRAIRQARQDFRTLAEISRIVSAPFEETPALVQAQMDKARTLEKNLARALTDLARREGRELYEATAPDQSGLRRATQRGAIDEAMRARAQAFTGGAKAVFLAISENPPAVLLAASPDSGVNAGERVKTAVSAAGGRGGGNAAMAQGSVPSAKLESIIAELC
ncbi:MAG TPA: alanyl-tRNA editing protein [Bryobacteraceae bacterium]|jgi:alanyl-tRNA synthetase|nr:alanyl-tRNA editing protein [Bryobacteraceae bacterium]